MEVWYLYTYGIPNVPDGRGLFVTKVVRKGVHVFSPYSVHDWIMNPIKFNEARDKQVYPVNQDGSKFDLKRFILGLKGRKDRAKKKSVADSVIKHFTEESKREKSCRRKTSKITETKKTIKHIIAG